MSVATLSPTKLPSRMRALLWVVLGLVLIGMVAASLLIRANKPRAEVGAGYMARVVCSCRYVGNRDLKSCLDDSETGMEIVTVTDDPLTRTITAKVPLLANRSARYSPAVNGLETGCVLTN
jgi:hypothetical protein